MGPHWLLNTPSVHGLLYSTYYVPMVSATHNYPYTSPDNLFSTVTDQPPRQPSPRSQVHNARSLLPYVGRLWSGTRLLAHLGSDRVMSTVVQVTGGQTFCPLVWNSHSLADRCVSQPFDGYYTQASKETRTAAQRSDTVLYVSECLIVNI